MDAPEYIPVASRGATAAWGLLLASALLAAGGCRRAEEPPGAPSGTTPAAAPGARPPPGEAPALDSASVAEVRAAFERSREALRALDAEAFLAGYAEGPGLVVVDPSGEYVGRESYESYVRDWFEEARRRSQTYPLVTAPEQIRPLGDDAAALIVHWSGPGGRGPYRSLLVYRRGPRGWRIAAEHSAPVPDRPEGSEGTDATKGPAGMDATEGPAGTKDAGPPR